VLGKHKGFWFHTIGQRKGLGLSQGPWFVVKKDVENNVIYVSNGYDPEAQYEDTIRLIDFLFINPSSDIGFFTPKPILFKIRHQPEFNEGTLEDLGNRNFLIHSNVRISGIAPGQFGVVYSNDGRICLGSGVIS